MSRATGHVALLLVRIAAVALAVGGVAWFSWSAHRNAQPANAPEATGTPEPAGLSEEEVRDLLLHTSKSLDPGSFGPEGGADTEIEEKTEKEVFLPSSKSLPFQESFGAPAGGSSKAPAPTPAEARRKKSEKPEAWLPSSKSLPPRQLPSGK